MEARFTSRDPDWLPATSRRWRSVLAGLISLALVLSFFHGWPFDGEDDTAAISIALTVDDFAGKTPADPASLDDLFGNGAPALRKLIDQLIPAPLSAHRRNRAMSRRRHY